MKWIRDRYIASSWYAVFNFKDGHGRSRSCLLFASIAQAVVNGFTTGFFYSGYLAGYGIDIVGISVLTLIPHIASLFSLLSPMILERFPRRRGLLTGARIAYYTVNILGMTFLPMAVQGRVGRMVGLVVIVFIANVIDALFSPGYSAWHMIYVDPEVRSGYFTASNLISNAASGVFLVVAGLVTDGMQGQSRQNLLLALRCASFAVAVLDVYFMQKPPEPEYRLSERPSLLSVLRIPFSNSRFLLVMLVYSLYTVISNLQSSVIVTWLLESVKVSYTYINTVNLSYVLFILPTSALWAGVKRRLGTFRALALVELLMVPSYAIHAFMTPANYFWVMAGVKLIQNTVNLGVVITVSNLIYLALPDENKTSYLSFYQLLSHLCALTGMGIGTWVVSAMGGGTLDLAGFSFGSVPVLFLSQSVLFILLVPLIRWVGVKTGIDDREVTALGVRGAPTGLR